MPSVLDSLKTRYEAMLQADTEARFYQNVHLYWDYILRTPALNDVLVASEKEYRQKHGTMWTGPAQTDEEADDHMERTIRLERFNLYAVGCTTLVRIYYPLDDYQKSLHESEFEQDPRAVVMMRGVDRINPDYAKKNPFKWGRDIIRSFGKWYTGQRPRYEGELKQFQLMLIDAIEKSQSVKAEPVQKPAAPEIPLKFNFHTGDFSLYGAEGNFSPASQEFKVLTTLLNSSEYQATFLELIQAAYSPEKEATKSNKALLYKIIDGIKNKLGVSVISNVPRVGYRLIFNEKEPEGKQP